MRTGYENTEENKIGNLTTFSRKVETTVKVISKTEAREVTSRRDLTTHRVADALVGDDTGSIYLTLWDEAIDEIEEGQILKLHNSYVKLFRGYMRLNIGRLGRLTFEILREAQEKKMLMGKDPRGVAAAALYLACKTNNEGCTQKEIAEAAGSTEVTLRNRLRDLEYVVEKTDLLE